MGSAGATSVGKGGSGGGGSTGKGGNGGSAGGAIAGAAGEENTAGGPSYELIDDMEDNNAGITGSGRDGFWQTENDGTLDSTQDPMPGAGFTMRDLVAAGSEREGSLYAAGMHVTGFVGSLWGALMVVSMRSVGTSIDGSAFCGLHFWAKRGTSNAELVVKVVDKHSSPEGGLCGAPNPACYDDFHTTVAVTTQWSDYTVRFSDLVQYGTGYQSPNGKIDAAAIHGIVFAVDEAEDFELLVDDLAFIHNGGCPP